MTTETTKAVEHYLSFWNAETRPEQDRLADLAFAGDVQYYAPVGVLSGAGALIEFRDQFAGHMGKVRFSARAQTQEHHGRVRLPWEIHIGDGTSFATGTDMLELGDDGRITAVTAFLDRAPEGFDHHEHA